ncbi:MAG: dihydrofolate reductase family protein [Candidatus Saccharimonadia bacterium]
MGRLIYSLTTTLDGYVADEAGNFSWTKPSEEILGFVDDILKNVGTFLLGRRMYETLLVWDSIANDGPSEGMNRFANIWKRANKIVYSTTLTQVTSPNTTLEPEFNAKEITRLIADSDKDFDIGGPHLSAEAIRAGMVDEFHQIIVPKLIGGGNFWLPDNVETELELGELKKFKNGFAYIKYRKKK